MRTFKRISDPDSYEAMSDKTRRRIVFLLRAREMTVSQLADALKKTTQAVYHQIRILQRVGMVEVAREERVGHLIEAYYRATAEIFIFQEGDENKAESVKMWSEALSALSKAGLAVRTDADFAERVAKANGALAKCGLQPDLEDKISKADESILFTNTRAFELARLAKMSDREFEQFLSSWRDLRGLMTSGVGRRKVNG